MPRTSLVVVALLALSTPAVALEHHDAADDWSVTLPDGWSVMPRVALDEYAADVSRRAGQPVGYRVGFHRSGQAYPFVVVQVHRVRQVTLDDACDLFAGPGVKQGHGEDARAPGGSDARTAAPLRKAAFMGVRFDDPAVGPIKGLIAICPGEAVAVQFNLYAREESAAQDLALLERMIGTFRAGPPASRSGRDPTMFLLGLLFSGTLAIGRLVMKYRPSPADAGPAHAY